MCDKEQFCRMCCEGEQHTTNEMDEYDKKFAEMQQYIPFLEAMIERLQNVKDKSREVQLQKMQSLHGILSNSKRKLKIETLQRCEDVLRKLHNKVEKGNTPELHFPKRSDPSSAPPSTATEAAASEQSKPARQHQPEKGSEEKPIHETPASPSPPVSPDSVPQVAPIIIPTERSVDFVDTSKPASPDPVETLPTKAPIIIPTERTSNDLGLSSGPHPGASKNADDVTFSEWEMLEESENQAARSKNWQSIVTSGHDVSAAIKLVGSNLPQKDSRTHVPIPITSSRHIPTVPVPSLGGSRRLSSVLEKGRMLGVSLEPPDARPESPVNVPDVRLKSPDPEILYPKHKNTSPRLKEAVQRPAAAKPPAPLLLSPPPVSAKPPLSEEDLAELMSEEGEGKVEKKSEVQMEKKSEVKVEKKSEKARDKAGKFKKRKPSKYAKSSKPFVVSQDDTDSDDRERTWNEIYKSIVQMSDLKCPITGAKAEPAKVSEAKGPGSLMHSSSSCPVNVEKAVDRNRPPSPGSKIEPRYADNYERHPRQLRDGHCRPPDESIPGSVPVHHNAPIIPEERNPPMYVRRPANVAPEIVPPRIDAECRMEGPEYFNRQIPPSQSHWTPMNDFGANQWPPSSTFNAMPNSPAQPYPHPMAMHQEMWNVGPPREPILMDPHQASDGQLRPGQFPANMNPGIRPLMSPTARPQDIAHIPRPEEMPNIDVPSVPTIQPLISPTRYPVGPQYRNFQGENRPYDASFDYSHQRQSWDSPATRPTDVPYRPENEVPCVPAEVPQTPYTRPSTPCPWTRDRDRGGGRGRSGYYNDRSRGENRNSFNRDARRPEWARESHEWDNCNRFGRDTRNVSDRDPRVRTEHPAVIQTPSQPRDNGAASVRDPRLAKDKHFSAAKAKEASFNERGPRKRSAAPPFPTSFRKAKDKLKSLPKPPESHRRSDTEKQSKEKSSKDKMQSPLESLYGVIDTKAKSAQGYCLQNFKIPKIKRNEPSESPTSSHNLDEGKAAECSVEKQYERASKKGRYKDDATAEVSSSSDGNILFENWNEGGGLADHRTEEAKEAETSVEHVEGKNDSSLGELVLISTTSSKPPEDTERSKKEEVEPEGSKPKEEVTQEWIEALIRKSFEHGEGKKFVEQAKFIQKLGEVLQAKKLKKIKKIIESESESSSSDKDDTFEAKKIPMRKKRRVIVSDSSDEESLAERLGILASSAKGSTQEPSANDQKSNASKNAEETTSSVESSDVTVSKSDGTRRVPAEAQSIAEEEEQPKGEGANVKEPETAAVEDKDGSKNEEQVEDKDNASKAPKAKARRRNSLEMLQEDIREMFISDDVVAATGHRLCRTQKEGQNVSASTSNQGTPGAKKDEPSKRDAEASSDVEEPLVSVSKPKKASKPRSEESSRSRGKCKKEAQRVTRQRSKQYNQSSDSEEDQPLALRTELAQNSGALSSRDSCNDESEMLRRSKRIINKETVKEPRVLVEKTDISKLDCSRVMFDSSSDESFGIDVSELAAAVDISLHPDKLSEPEAEPAAKKKSSQSSSKKAAKKKELPSEGKGDDGFLSDGESIISDISMSSSVASSKKAGFGLPKLDSSANEELLSNILVGLVPSKSDLEKDTSMADKGSDADIDDDASEPPVEPSIRKSSTKKKKKKCNWQMGILSKKKRKKAITSSSSPKGDSDAPNITSELNTSSKMEDSSVTDDKAVSATEKPKDSSTDLEASPSDQKLNNSLLLDDSADCKENIAASLTEEPLEIKHFVCTEAISNDGESKTVKNKLDKSFYDLDINTLIEYAWTGQERYKCLLCFFTGKNIVHHYKLNHPGKEILISRLKAADAQSAIQDAKDNDVENASLLPLTEQTCKFTCRVCPFFIEGAAKAAMEAFYEHCTTHTGEYRFRCNSCTYQAVAKSSMRTHFYKVCRKLKSFNESITEDEIPDENRIYGYLCSRCNYIQLKKRNVEGHVELWHQDNSKADVIKVNMSLEFVKLAPAEVLVSEMVKVEEPILSAEKLEGPVIDSVVSLKQDDDVSEIKPVESSEVCDEEKKTVAVEDGLAKEEEPVEVRPDNDEKKKPPQAEGDPSLPAGSNLSVFVCPPELEKKEVEIQLERKRKMQEIVQNIGIKLQKDAFKKGISIIDKLKDKMQTNIVATGSEHDSIADPDSSSKVAANLATPVDPTPSQSNVAKVSSTVPAAEDCNMNSPVQEAPEDKQSEDPVAITPLSSKEGESETISEADQSESKVRDPLATLGQKKDESDAENSDTENTTTSAPVYESDSSSEQSDTEPPTDVNMILQETSNINASSKDPMLTTIQRLAAQLQATKPLEASKEEEASKPAKPTETLSFLGSIPKPPDVVPISSIKRFVGKLQNKIHEVSPETREDADAPKNFIRLRRLSGDKLSVTPPSVLEDSPTTNDGSEASAPGAMTSVLKLDDEEECSFLKIENVVSLAPRADVNSTESPIIHDIRKAVETSPMKSKGVSVLKKSKSPLILTRLNPVTMTQPLTKSIQAAQSGTSDLVKLIPMKSLPASPVSMTAAQLTTNYIPIAPKSKIIQVDNKTLSVPIVSKNTVVTPVTTRTVTVGGSPQLSNLNYKILKVVRTPTILKPRDTLTPVGAIKLKSADAYKAMLNTDKLTHLYKCMGRECCFTTDALEQYQQHYLQHASEAEKLKLSPPHDFQNCAYCYMVLKDWSEMKLHVEDKHTHCRYQCCYCFYRGIAPSYVLMHQAICHSGHHGLIIGKLLKEVPMGEEINRHDYVQPYICQHDCGKFFYVPESFMGHLKAKHGSLLSAFKCHMCRVTCPKIEQLITHYKTHGLHKYQCLYCLSGSDSFNDMHVHLSTFHCNRLPRILERSLPPQPVRNKDVIDQLVIRILDDNFKISEESIDRDAKTSKEPVAVDTVDTPPSDPPSYTQLPKEVNMLNKEENEALNKSLSSLFGASNNQTTSSKSSSGGATSEPGASEPAASEPADKSPGDTPADKSTTPSERNSVDPLEVSTGSFDCTDEFINMNLLDNPDFLKNISSHSSDSYFPNNTAASDSKAEDSDIEIVDIVDTGSATIRDIKYMPDSGKKDSPGAKGTAEAPSRETDTKEQSYSDVENSSASTDTNGTSSSSATKVDKPLTLEDIKDTGLIGAKLYKCGYEGCDQSAQSAVLLRSHVKECSLSGDNKNLNCAHCSKRFMKVGFLLEHLKVHGLKRFGCSLCKMRCTVGYQAMAHMKTKHKAPNSKLVPADPKNPSVDGLFIVHPLRQGVERRGKKRKSTKSLEKEFEKLTTDNEKLSFSPDEIESLPRQAIYNREVQCAVCPYTTKVRTNIIRHLLLHAKDEKVPESGPVNPVPCLDKKERMFDKMVNLASSSHQNGRMGGKVKEPSKDNDDEFIPKFVPEHKRYVCGVAECNYLTVDEAMLRCHLKALHSEEQYFRCPHCPQPSPEGLNIAIDKMGVHLKMHDTRLYKCSHCNHHHYHRHVVERHLTDKHSEKRPFVKVIRELENTENSQSVQEEVEEEVPDPDGNHWKCNICEHKCVYKAEMANHATTAHDEKCQYKCTLCPFKTSGKIMFEQHINSKHHNDPNVDYIMVYQRIKGVNKRTVDNVEQGGQEEPFDTTPLWRRDMPRIRHIRGILLEEDEGSSESSKPGKRKSDVEQLSAKPAKIKPGKSNSLDDAKQVKEKSKRLSSSEKVPGDSENSNESSAVAEKAKETKFKTIEDNDFNDSDVGRFGPYGKPDGNMYVCTLCTQFKSKYKHDMRDHLYRELNYSRWHCKECGYLSVNRNALLKHFTKRHNGERPNHEPLTPDDDIEDWVGTLLKRQTLMIKGLLSKQSTSTTDTSAVTSASGTSAKASPVKVAQNTSTKSAKAAPLPTKSLNPQDSKVPESPLIDLDALDDSSKDNEGLAEAKDEVPAKKERPKNTAQINRRAEGDREKTLICKHCNMAFTRWRGFKLHVQLTHLKRLGFVCPHCDRSTNSESLMLQHIRSKHPGCPEKLVQNPAAGGPELTDEFWQKEYGLVFPKKSKKRKRKLSEEEEEEEIVDEAAEQSESEVKCNFCSFTSIDLTGLKEHMKVHGSGSLSCAYCTFVSSTKTEYWEHWERNHPFTPFTFDEATAAESPNEPGSAQADKRIIIDDYSDDIEEEHVSDIRDDELIFCCFYCSFRDKSLDAVQSHWSSTHKESKPGCPFRYKEMHEPADTVSINAQSSKAEESPYELYMQRSQGDVQEVESHGARQDGWICQWCNELCDSEVKMKTHHSMFHSHLPLNFKKRDKDKPARGYVCPECSFTTTFLNVMKSHVAKHINLFKCKYCEKAFGSPTQVSAHNAQEHPDLELKIESIQNYEALLEKIMANVKWLKPTASAPEEKEAPESPRKNHAVARKSTARPTVRPSPMPYKVKAVARKSTNPHSRFLVSPRPTERYHSPAKNRQFSYYGIPSSPINLSSLNTYMVVGGHRMKVNCTTLAQLINIDPKVLLRDLKHNIRYLAALKKSK